MAFQIASLKDSVHPDEWQLRVDLAACYRLVALYGWDDLIFTHLSARIPGPEHHFLINPYDMMFEEITASSLIKIDHDGNILSKPDFGDLNYGINKAGYVIHSAVHEARPELACVIHTHSTHCVALSLNAQGPELLPPITPYFVMKVGRVPLLPYHRPGDPAAAQCVAQAITSARDAGAPIRAVMLDRLGPNVWHGTPSTKSQNAAPRESASMPKAPEPAKASSTLAPGATIPATAIKSMRAPPGVRIASAIVRSRLSRFSIVTPPAAGSTAGCCGCGWRQSPPGRPPR